MQRTFSVFLLGACLCMASGCGVKPSEKREAQPPPAATPPSDAGAAAVEHKPTPAPIDRNAQVVVIGYHRLVDKVKHPDTEITPDDFEAQMQQIKDAGISVISMKDFLAWRRGEKNIPARSAIITLDDGWNSAYEVAWPILKKFGYPFTLFIYTDYVKGGPKSGGGSLTWSQLGELRDAGADIESHTVSHRDLRGRKRQQGTAEYEEWLWKELAGSKQQLEQQLGISVKALALPYGSHNEHVRQTASRAGYEAVFTVEGKSITSTTSMDSLGRYIVFSSKPNIFADAIRFGDAPASGGATAAHVDSSTIETEPPDGSVVTEAFPVLKANLAPFGNIDAESVQMRISGFGIVPAQYDPASKILTFRLKQNLQEKEYSVIVSFHADGRRMETRWKFTFSGARQAR
jgi:peptidoglycan/xylan/chitin deacetylase (PgdA/CDA1 family)